MLTRLNKAKFSDIELREEDGLKVLEELQTKLHADPKNPKLIDQERHAANEYRILKMAKEKFLLQRCKIKWLKEGDLNTRFFHPRIKARRHANRAFRVKDKGEKIE